MRERKREPLGTRSMDIALHVFFQLHAHVHVHEYMYTMKVICDDAMHVKH